MGRSAAAAGDQIKNSRRQRLALVTVILTTRCRSSPRITSPGILFRDEATLPTIAAQVARNNEIVRVLDRDFGLAMADAAALTSQPSLFADDCYLRPNGEQALAEHVDGNDQTEAAPRERNTSASTKIAHLC
jgi:hypothetical protein